MYTVLPEPLRCKLREWPRLWLWKYEAVASVTVHSLGLLKHWPEVFLVKKQELPPISLICSDVQVSHSHHN